MREEKENEQKTLEEAKQLCKNVVVRGRGEGNINVNNVINTTDSLIKSLGCQASKFYHSYPGLTLNSNSRENGATGKG